MSHTLIDIGVNLVHRRFAPDREAVLRRAQAAGVAASAAGWRAWIALGRCDSL